MAIADRKCAGIPGKPCEVIFTPLNGGHERCLDCGREWRLARQRKYCRENRGRKESLKRKASKTYKGELIDESPYEIIGSYRVLRWMQRMADL